MEFELEQVKQELEQKRIWCALKECEIKSVTDGEWENADLDFIVKEIVAICDKFKVELDTKMMVKCLETYTSSVECDDGVITFPDACGSLKGKCVVNHQYLNYKCDCSWVSDGLCESCDEFHISSEDRLNHLWLCDNCFEDYINENDIFQCEECCEYFDNEVKLNYGSIEMCFPCVDRFFGKEGFKDREPK